MHLVWTHSITFISGEGSYSNNREWAVGVGVKSIPEVDIDYPTAAADAFVTHLAPSLSKQGKKFRFAFTSGALASSDQNGKTMVLAGC